MHSSALSVTDTVLNVQTEERSVSLPDEVGAVAAERRLFKETSDERVFFDAVHVLLTQGSTPLDAARRPPAARRRRGATVSGTDRRRGGWVLVVDGVAVHCVTHRETMPPTTVPASELHRHVQTRAWLRILSAGRGRAREAEVKVRGEFPPGLTADLVIEALTTNLLKLESNVKKLCSSTAAYWQGLKRRLHVSTYLYCIHVRHACTVRTGTHPLKIET